MSINIDITKLSTVTLMHLIEGLIDDTEEGLSDAPGMLLVCQALLRLRNVIELDMVSIPETLRDDAIFRVLGVVSGSTPSLHRKEGTNGISDI